VDRHRRLTQVLAQMLEQAHVVLSLIGEM
jgi:hypothetical protein